MAIVTENAPLMVLTEASPERLTFRFRGGRWAVATLVMGVALAAGTRRAEPALPLERWASAVMYAFSALLLYSSVYSLTARQWLVLDGRTRSVRYHKWNLYGRVDWERPADQFEEIRIAKPSTAGRHALNWAIVVVGRDGSRLFLGENELGSLDPDRAIALARRVGAVAGIQVKGPARAPQREA